MLKYLNFKKINVYDYHGINKPRTDNSADSHDIGLYEGDKPLLVRRITGHFKWYSVRHTSFCAVFRTLFEVVFSMRTPVSREYFVCCWLVLVSFRYSSQIRAILSCIQNICNMIYVGHFQRRLYE